MAVAELPGARDADFVQEGQRSLFAESMRRLFRNKAAVASLIFIVLLTIVAIFPRLITDQSPIQQDLLQTNAVPERLMFVMPDGAENYAKVNNDHFLGTDHLGRDLWARTIYGARVSLAVAFVASAVSLGVGIIYGSIAGYVGGWLDNVMMRIVDFLYGFPFLIVVILLQAYFKAVARQANVGEGGFASALLNANQAMGGMLFLFIAIGLIDWLQSARISRGQVLSYKNEEFVEAARAVGAGDLRIMFRHLLPNILGPLIVAETLAIPGYIFTEAFLSFIGLGVNPPTPSWGIMISDAVQGLRSYPNQILVPAVMLSLTTLAFNFLGDGLRDAFDPRQIR
jgi:oligopeptide transport system permease protein